jgi:MFS family permease
MSNAAQPFNVKGLAVSMFLPTLLFSIGEGALIPLLPVAAGSLGASLSIAAVVSAMLMIGELIGDIPSGWLVARVGERAAMIGAAFVSVAAVLLAILAPNPFLLGVAVFLLGLATAVFALARHAFMTTYVPLRYRARALSTLGGTFRAGLFIGPLLAAPIIHLTGTPQSAFWIMATFCVLAAIILVVLPDPSTMIGRPNVEVTPEGALSTSGAELVAEESVGLFRTVWRHRGILLKLGSGAALVAALRSARTVMLPLWAVSIGVSEANTALIIGLAGAIDFGLFYLSGQIMDKHGRKWSAIPAMIGLGAGMALLALTHDVPGAVAFFIAAAVVQSLANGIGSGILMTLGADVAPPADPAPFLGAWRFTTDAGAAAAPLVIAGVTAVVSLPAAAAVMAVLALVGAGILARNIPPHASLSTHR